MSRDMIYQVCVGQVPEFYRFCIGSVEDYCKRFGIEHCVQYEPKLKIRPLNSHRSANAVNRCGYLPIFEKENALGLVHDYDRIAIIDADVFIKPDAPNVFDELGEATFAAVVERDMPITTKYGNKIQSYSRGQYGPLKDVDWKWGKYGAEFMNMGVSLLSCKKLAVFLRGQTPEQFIRRQEFERFVNGEGAWRWQTEQTLFNWWLRKEGVPLKHLSWKWNAMYNAIRPESLREAFFVHFFLSVHLPEGGAEIPRICKELCS